MSTSHEERKAKARAAAPKDNRRTVALVAALVALLVVAGVAWAVLSQRKDQDAVDKALAGATKPVNATKDGGGIVVNPGKAKPGAPTLVVYQDFQCPICKQVEDLVGPTINSLADQGKINLEYHIRSFLDGNVERMLGGNVPNPDSSARATAAALCADQVGAFRAYHDQVFKHQPEEGKGYTDQQLTTTFPQAAGLTGGRLATFQQCVKGGTMKGYVTSMEQAGAKAGNTGTPEYKLDGKTIDFRTLAQDPKQLEKLVAAATKK